MSEHLLPANATALEIAISLATDVEHLYSAVDAIGRFKSHPKDDVIPYLVWEYALEELLPYLPDPRWAIRDGVLWQRLRGTPKALEVALAWIGARATRIEQEEAGGAHWAEYQFDSGRVLSDDEVARYVAVARLSAPARSRLSRIYHGHDLRRVVLDGSRLGDALLSDHSGTLWVGDGSTRLSFGRVRKIAHPVTLTLAHARASVHAARARYPDRCLLDEMRFGCLSAPNPQIEHGHAFEWAQQGGVSGRAACLPERRFAKAQVVLSEQWALGDTNATTPVAVWVMAEVFRLGDPLSSGIGRGQWVAILERFERAQQAAPAIAPVMIAPAANRARNSLGLARRTVLLSQARLSAERGAYDVLGRAATRSADVKRKDARQMTRPERRFAKAQVVLSEQWALGDTNARTARSAWQAIRPSLRLGELRLDDAPVIVRAPLDEVFERGMRAHGSAASALATQRAFVRLHALAGAASRPTMTNCRGIELCGRAAYVGQRWTGHAWPATTWRDARELMASAHQSS